MNFQGGKIIQSAFEPNAILKNQHLQTLWPTLFRKDIPLRSIRERLTTADNDFIDIDWLEQGHQPLILLIHGLASSSKAKYIKGLQKALSTQGFASVAMNLRGCSGEPNKRSRSYHGGSSDDLNLVIETLRARFPNRPLGAVGFSLGANILLKWLSETSNKSHLFAAISVSAPLQLNLATERLQQGFSKVYEQYLLSFMKWNHYQKLKHFQENLLHGELKNLQKIPSLWKIKTIADFDEYITAPLHGFDDASVYYQTCSSRQSLTQIHTPTLILHAKDDPFMPPQILPQKKELSSSIIVETSDFGGHVGFIASDRFGLPSYWLESRVPEFFNQLLEQAHYKKPETSIFAYPSNQ